MCWHRDSCTTRSHPIVQQTPRSIFSASTSRSKVEHQPGLASGAALTEVPGNGRLEKSPGTGSVDMTAPRRTHIEQHSIPSGHEDDEGT